MALLVILLVTSPPGIGGGLSNYDLAYAPPFNTTWDPVLTAAKVVDGKR